MSIFTIDFETYYSKTYSLTKMTTEEYVNHPEFQVICVGVKRDDEPAFIVPGEDAQEFFDSIDWADHAILCHNTMFDGAILSWKFGVKPMAWLDTLGMARAKHGIGVGGSLKALASYYAIGEKGTEVIDALGKRREDFLPVEMERYMKYCVNDVELTYKLFYKMMPFPSEELDLIDLTLKMYTDPVLEVDDALLVTKLEDVRDTKKKMLQNLAKLLGCEEDEEALRKQLSSNKQFADVLRKYGVEPPMKISPTTGKETYALAKNDVGFLELTEHDDEIIQELCRVRLGTKSTLEESRIERFIGVGARNRSRIPVPLRYYGAHTGRWSGTDSINFQNLPSRDKNKKALKKSILAPEGYTLINCDSSQIEARVLAWWAAQNDVVKQFAKGDDVYSVFASKVYGFPVSKVYPIERFVGKTCVLGLGYGTGAAKLRHTLKTQPPGAELTEDECKRIVDIYRTENFHITNLWLECDKALSSMVKGGCNFPLGQHNVVTCDGSEVVLPNGLRLRYPNLRMSNGQMVYDSRAGEVNIWGGGMVENVVQALARIIVGEQMLAVAERYRVALTVHDAVVAVVKDEEVDEAMKYITGVMSTPPDWAPDLPVACEAKHGKTYGDC